MRSTWLNATSPLDERLMNLECPAEANSIRWFRIREGSNRLGAGLGTEMRTGVHCACIRLVACGALSAESKIG